MSEACKRKCTNAKHLVCSTYKMYLKSKTKDRVNDMFEGNYPSQMNHFLCKAAQALEAWLARVLPKTGVNWWEECVLSNLTPFQRKRVGREQAGRLNALDLDVLLRVADKAWYIMQTYTHLPSSIRESICDLADVENRWLYYHEESYPEATLFSDLEKLSRFFRQIGCGDILTDLEDFKSMVDQQKAGAPKAEYSTIQNKEDTNNIIAEKSLVDIVGKPGLRGMVFSVSTLGDTHKYEVFVDGALRTYYDGQIAPIIETPQYEWTDAQTLRSYLSAYQINNPSSGNLYSLNAARIDFVPYQFRPALKLIRTDEPRILIADSVGVGKTIEAGLIIKELEARSNLEKILIICPKPLVADRKWENEMKRFDEEFIPLDGDMLRQLISDTDRDGEWPSRYGKVIIPYSILDKRTLEGQSSRGGRSFGLQSLDPVPHFDLVIIDEAHHLRNGSLDKEKAYAYKCVHYFCEHADAVVMLTATPLQTSNDDLYTLLNLLRPDIIIDKSSFDMMAKPNPYIAKCSHIVRAAQEGWQAEALETIGQVLTTQWGRTVIANNPVFGEVRQALIQKTISREDRVKLITNIESLHSFDMMLNRTRRRDIQDFCVRRTYTLESGFTDKQRQLHDALLAFEMAALAKLHGSRGVSFMMSTLKRQAASCIFGLAPHIKDLIARRFDQLQDDLDFDFGQSGLAERDFAIFVQMATDILKLANALPPNDPKFEGVLEIVQEKQKAANNKIILFSTFRYTLRYVGQRLKEAGIRVDQIDGSTDANTRLELRRRFELPKEDVDALDILLFTEVGSEGLDYQFCDTMINYDLPWNPMRIEQRIGRIDRRGQKSEVVNIYNVITCGTIDAEIYKRCLLRIGVFESSIGECEEILGEIGKQIEAIAMDVGLTEAEREAKLEQMADNKVRRMQEINRLEQEEKAFFGFDLSNYLVSREIRDAESPFLTARSLQHLVEMYLSVRLGPGAYILGEDSLKRLRLNAIAREELLSDLRRLPNIQGELRRQWEAYLKSGQSYHLITFGAETAEKERGAFFITPVHPLVRQAAAHFVADKPLHVHLAYDLPGVPSGDYPISIYAWDYIGVRSDFRLVVVCEESHLAEELPEYLLSATTVESPAELQQGTWDALEKRHVQMWQEERERHIVSTKRIASYKLECLKNNFQNRKTMLEGRIAEMEDLRIITMHKAALKNATERYHQRVAVIEAQSKMADIHTTLIANGVITVR